MALLDTYLVGIDGPWSEREVGHLFRRAAYGATPAEKTAAMGAGDQATFEATVDSLVNFAPDDPYLDAPGVPGTGVKGDPLATLPDDGSLLARVKRPDVRSRLETHWAYRMVYTSQPLQEQFTLFLHDHMVSEWVKVRGSVSKRVGDGNDGSQTGQQCTTGTLAPDPNRRNQMVVDLLLTQNYLFRHRGIDDFRRLLIDITRDPAMLLYLDNAKNRRGNAQENYAREIMELFSMGVDNYSEDDVREVAKCFTGEGLPLTSCANDWQYHVYGFQANRHEPGSKFVFGKTVAFDNTGKETEDVVDLILDEVGSNPDVSALGLPATAVYMSWKLLHWFVNQDIALFPEPDPAVIELAQFMNGTDNGVYPQRRYRYDMRAVMRKILLSKYFHAPENYYNMIKNPVDFVVRALRCLSVHEDFDGANPQDNLDDMGMRLFAPPDVAGWNHGTAWISSGATIARFNYGYRIGTTLMNNTSPYWNQIDQANGGPFQGGDLDPDTALVDYYAPRLLDDPPTTDERNLLLEFLSLTPGTATTRFRNKVRGLIHVIMAMPKYQLK